MKHSANIKPIVAAITQARQSKGLSQTELGKRLGLPQSYISRLESGRLDVRLSGLIEIARYLGIEFMPVPQPMVPIISSILHERNQSDDARPLYSLDDPDYAEFE